MTQHTPQDSQSELQNAVYEIRKSVFSNIPEMGVGEALELMEEEVLKLIEAYVTTRVKEAERLARIDELSHIGMDDDEVIVCYFTQENPDCSKDLSIGDRIAELEALTTTTNGKDIRG